MPSPNRTHRPTPAPLAAAALLALAGVHGLAGCAAPQDRPAYRELDELDGDEPTDVRTIDATEDAPGGPISPTGAEIGRGDDSVGDIGAIFASDSSDDDEPAATTTATTTATNAASPSEGYRTVGSVLLEVNGRPIFSDELIAARRNALRGHAKRLDKPQFMAAALIELREELQSRMKEEFERAVLEDQTSPEDVRRARLMTMVWRDRFISEHGGSEAVARRVAYEQEGMSLERLGEEEYQRQLAILFLQTRLGPQTRPTADDVRTLYRQLRDAGELSTPAQIDFALIEIRPDPGASPDSAAAAAKAEATDVRERAAAGEDFAQLAEAFSDNASYAARGGRLPEALRPLRPGSYRIAAVDEAAWATGAGEVAPLVETSADGGPVYFVVKTLEKTEATEVPFEDVQARLIGQIQLQRQNELMRRLSEQQQQRISSPTQEDLTRVEATLRELLDQQYESLRAS